MTDDDLPIKPATRLVQAGRRAEWTKGVVNVPVWRGSTVLYENVAHMRATGAGDLQIDGQIKGDVRVGRLIVGETGAVEGNVQADYIEVRGRIVGGVQGKQIKLVATAYVEGDITAEQLSIDVGAFFQGRVAQGQRQAPAPAPVAPVAPQPTPAPAAEAKADVVARKPNA